MLFGHIDSQGRVFSVRRQLLRRSPWKLARNDQDASHNQRDLVMDT